MQMGINLDTNYSNYIAHQYLKHFRFDILFVHMSCKFQQQNDQPRKSLRDSGCFLQSVSFPFFLSAIQD